MCSRRNSQQTQTAEAMVSMSCGKKVVDKLSWLRDDSQTLDPKIVDSHLKIIGKLLQRHVGQVGNVRQLQNMHPLDFYNGRVKNTSFAYIHPEKDEHMFMYLTRLIKHMHAMEKKQVADAAKTLLFMNRKKQTSSQQRQRQCGVCKK